MPKPIMFNEISKITESSFFKSRDVIYNSLRQKMLDVGFVFEKEQKPHHQNKKERELKFIHPRLIEKLEDNGYKVRAKKFYIKPLSDRVDSEIGFVTGKSSPLNTLSNFNQPNSIDLFDNAPAWTNTRTNQAVDDLLMSIKNYLNNRNHPTEAEEALFANWLLENHQDIQTPYEYISAIKSISNDLKDKIDSESIYMIKDVSELKKIQKNLRINKIYYRVLHLLIEYVSDNQDTTSKDIIEIIKSDDQEKEKLILARIGQGQFRKELIDIWNGCSISKYSDVSLLIASHIKPWCKCDNHEKIDPGNGLLLLPNYDKLFDRGYISFDEDGKVIISKRLSKPEIFGINNNMSIELTKDNKRYMKYHREEVFK